MSADKAFIHMVKCICDITDEVNYDLMKTLDTHPIAELYFQLRRLKKGLLKEKSIDEICSHFEQSNKHQPDNIDCPSDEFVPTPRALNMDT
jgi:hypothetical protein